MESIEKIKRRIERQYQKKKTTIWRTLSLLMMIFTMAMGFLIYAKKDENGSFLKEHFNIETSFVAMNENISSFLNSVFNFNIFNNQNALGNDQTVNGTVAYINEGENYFSYETNEVRMLKSGTILFTSFDSEGQIVIASLDNGVVATYFMLQTIEVKVYDQLKEGDTLGTYNGKFKVLFSKENHLIKYEEAVV